MVGALFDIVNAAAKSRTVLCCSATQTQHRQGKNHLQIQHDKTRSSSTAAWLLSHVPMHAIVSRCAPSLYPAFTGRRIRFAARTGQRRSSSEA
jgi:hypothetical protein